MTEITSNLQSALGCLSQCDCCSKVDLLQQQVNTLSQQFNNLDNKFVSKNEFQVYKKHIEDSFQGIRVGFDNVWKRLDALEKGKTGYQEISAGRIPGLRALIQEIINGSSPDAYLERDIDLVKLDVHELRTELELAKLDIKGLRFIINNHIRDTTGEGEDVQEVKRQLRGLLEKLRVVEDIQRAVSKEARDARELTLRTHERMNDLYAEWQKNQAKNSSFDLRIKKIEIELKAYEFRFKALEYVTAALTKTTALLGAKSIAQGAAIITIGFTIGGMALAIADLYRRIANINSGRDYAQEIEMIRDVASKAYIKADKANRGVEVNNLKISQLEQNTSFRFTKLEIQFNAVKQDIKRAEDNITRLYDHVNAVKADTVRVFHELNEEIKYLTERSRAAMERLEAFIKSEIAFLTSSTLSALLRLQGRIERNESLINDAQSKANSAIKKADKAIKDAELAIKDAGLAINGVKLLKPDVKTALDKSILAIKDAGLAINGVKLLKPDVKTALDKSILAIKDSARAFDKATIAIDLGEINNLQIIDLRVKLATIPQQIKNEIIPTIPPIAEEYARKFAYRGPTIDIKEIERGYKYSEDTKLDKLKRELDAEFDKQVKQGFDKLFGGRNPFAQLEAISQATENMRVEFGQLAALQQKAAQGNRAALEELSRVNERNVNDFRNGVNDFTRFGEKVKEIEKKIAIPVAPQIIEPEIDKKIAPITVRQANTEKDIADIKIRLQERERVDKDVNEKLKIITPILPELNAKLDNIIPTILGLPIIMGRIPDQTVGKIPGVVAPLIPTVPQIGNVVQEKVCNPQCQLPSVTAGNNATNAVNQAKNDLGDKIDKTNNAAQTGMLVEILSRLGDKIPGGLSGKLTKGFKWLQLDKAIGMLTLWVTLHNAVMLSGQLGDTLLSVIENGLSLIGLKDDQDQAIDLNEVLGNEFRDIIIAAIGQENYVELSKAWLKANRVYQASANVAGSVTNMNNTILNGVELVAGQNAKIGNALRNYGAVGDKAYEVFNPNPNLHWGIFSKLQNGQEAADFLLQVSQVPLDVIQAGTDLTMATTEFVKAVKEDPDVSNIKGIEISDAQQTKQKETESKEISQGKDVTDSSEKLEAE